MAEQRKRPEWVKKVLENPLPRKPEEEVSEALVRRMDYPLGKDKQ